MEASIVDLRYRMKDVLRAIDRGETVTVTYRGKEKARLVPAIGTVQTVVNPRDHPARGMWKDREDMADPVAYIRKLRQPRYAHLYQEVELSPRNGRRKKQPVAAAKRKPPRGR